MSEDASVLSFTRLDSIRSFLKQAPLLLALLVLTPIGHASETELDDLGYTESLSSESPNAEASLSSSVGEGFSVREKVSADEELGWSSVASAGYNRYLVELAVPAWTVGGGLTYKFSKQDALSANASYSSPVELETSTPELYGIEDVELSWVHSDLWTHEKIGKVSSSVKWRLPTSQISQRLTQISSFTGALTLSHPMPPHTWLRHLTLSAMTAIAITPHQYDRRAIGTLNSPFGFTYGLGGSYKLLEKVSLSSSYAMTHRVEYDGYMMRIQTLSMGATVTLPESLTLSGGYQWRDSVLTNDPFLYADNTLAYLELSRAF